MKKLICVLVVMLLAVNASAIVWMGTSTAGGAAGGDGTWGDIDNWVDNFDASWDAAYPNSTGQYGLPEVGTSSATPASALPSSADLVYVLSAPDNVYTTWNTGPRAIDPAYNGGPATVNGSAQAGDLYVGYVTHSGVLNVSSTGTLNVAGSLITDRVAASSYVTNEGTVTVAGDLMVGFQTANGTGAVTNSGTLNVGGFLSVDTGHVFNMTGGTATVGGALDLRNYGTISSIQLDGGTITAGDLLFDDWYQDNLDITEGVLILDGDVTGQVVWNEATGQPDLAQSFGLAWWTASVPFDTGDEDPSNDRWVSLMTAYGGAGTIMYDYDNINPGQTTIWAVPEPATMTLLGLGAVVLLRRRK